MNETVKLNCVILEIKNNQHDYRRGKSKFTNYIHCKRIPFYKFKKKIRYFLK
jgi:hypothetical protein